MKKILLALLLITCTCQLYAADYYWVGGGGNWSDLNHWRLGSSSGSIPSIVPAAADNVIFGANAGFGTTTATRTVTVNGNVFCNNMTWTSDVPNSPIISRSSSYLITMYGNLVLNSSVTYTLAIDLVGSANASLTTNGAIGGSIIFTINKPNSGLTLADNFIFSNTANGSIILTEGYFNVPSKNVVLGSFVSNGNNTKSVDISNSTLTVGTWDYRGTSKTLNATGSVLKSGTTYIINDVYPEVEIGAGNAANISVNNCTIPKLTFTNTSTSTAARIASGNTITQLIFLSSGAIVGNDNIVNSVTFAGNGTVAGNTNTVSSITIEGNGNVSGSANNITYINIKGQTTLASGTTPNTFGTLLTAANKSISISGINNISTLFRAGGSPCDGFTEITGTSSGTLNFTVGAVANIDNVLLTNLSATGANIPLAVNGIDNDGNSGFTITEPTGITGTLYWVGGAGDWNDKNHWSNASGGTGGACIPFKGNDVVFDALSGFAASSKTITTTSNTYFNNMTWTNGVLNSPIFNESSSYTMRAYGSVSLAPTVTMNAEIRYLGTNAVTFTANGNTLGTLYNYVEKTGSGGLTLTDNWSNVLSRFYFNSGFLNLSGKTLSIHSLYSTTNSTRDLNIQNATINVAYMWQYTGSNKQIESTGSYIESAYLCTVDGLQYPTIHLTSTSSGASFSINSTTINELLFTGTGPTNIAPRIGSNNTINTLIFSGGGVLGGNNVVNYLEFKGIGYLTATGNAIGTLLTAPNRNYWFTGITTISTKFKAVNPSCNGLGEIRSYNSSTATLQFGSNAVVEVDNVYLENIAATGGGGTLNLPIVINGADAGGNSGWTISTSTDGARYWVGGGGDWNDANHWSTASGGVGGACIPTVGNDVFFDANSGFGTTTATRTVTVSAGNAYFHNMSWAGALNSPIFTKSSSWALECWGNSLVLNPTATLNVSYLLLKGAEATIMQGSTLGNFDLLINKPGGSFTLASDYSNTQTLFSLVEGNFSAAGRTLNIDGITNAGNDNLIYLDISNATINGNWVYNGGTTKRTLNASNSTINGVTMSANGFTYDKVNLSGVGTGNASLIGTTIGELTFTNASTTSLIGVNGTNNTIGRLEYKGSGGIYGTGNTIGTLIFFPGNIYTLNSGTNTTITGEWYGSGSPCKPTEIVSSSTTVAATVTKTTGKVDFDYVRLRRITATGGAIFNAKEHSTDLGGNTGWNISPYDGASPILGLGPDVGLKNSDLPYTLSTDGFFGSPLSQYVWKKAGNTISTASQLIVTEPGVYSVDVTFPDGCNISDEITLTLVSADLSIIKTVDNSTPAVGGNVVFTLTAHNDGPAAGTEVTVTDLLPTGYTYVSDTAPVGTTYAPLTGIWNIGNLTTSADQVITITAKVNAAGDYLNKATINGTSDDPIIVNNIDSVTLVPSPSVIVNQPTCAVEKGSIEVPLVAGGTYSIDGGANFNATNIFSNLIPGSYSVVVKIGLSTSSAINVTINEAPAAPDAPISGGNQSVCATSPIQTLTATATVPTGATLIWYDAASGGNVVAQPILNSIGTVIYYAETNNGTCSSKSRTAVILSINASPEITALADQDVCTNYTLPVIAGTNLTGNEAYYTQTNGGGTKYTAGTLLSAVGTQTLYLYDKAVSNLGCAGNINVTSNSTLSDNVLLSSILSGSHYFYPRTVNANFWNGTANQVIDYATADGTYVYSNLVGDLQINSDPLCTGSQVEIKVGATYKNDGPIAALGYSGHLTIANKATGEVLYTKAITTNFPVGVSTAFNATTIVPASDLVAGNLVVIFGVETAQGGYKNWTLSSFSATYKYLSETPCPDEKSFKLTINALPSVPVSGGNQEDCATSPLQTLTATATVASGATLVWYDALTGGNVVALPTLNAVGTITYYAEAVQNNCVSSVRTPVKLTINQSPFINAIANANACGSFTFPAIAGSHLSGNQAYYTGLNKTGFKYSAGDVLSTVGETTLYAYDEIIAGAGQNTEGTLSWTTNTGYTNTQLQALYPDYTRTFARVVTGNPTTTLNFAAYPSGSLASVAFKAVVGKLTLPAGYVNAGDQVLVSVGNGFIRDPLIYPPAYVGYAGQLSIINTATNQFLYQTSFGDILGVNGAGVTPSVSGLVPAADLIAGNISVYIEFKGSNVIRVSGLAAKYEFISNSATCTAQQSFKVNINNIPASPTANNQTACADSPIQTLTAVATVPMGSTVVWYDTATSGAVVANPTLNAVGTITYYAETHTGTCISATRTPVVLTINTPPTLTLHDPGVVCHPTTIDLTAASITTGSTSGLTYTYFTDAAATLALVNPATVALSGTYYIKGTNTVTGCSIVAPVVVQFVDKPSVTTVHQDCVNPTGSISVTSPLGTGFEYAIDGSTYQTATLFDNLAPGNYSVTARNTTLVGCVSDATSVIINATPTTATPLVTQPGCGETTGSIKFPVDAAYEYSIDSAPFTTDNEFTGLAPASYSIQSKKAGDVCIADPVTVIIVANVGQPTAPVASNQQACANSPIQTLTASATVQVGETLKWYNAATGGSIVTQPTLNTVGSITYYAESSNGTCVSTSRTAVQLTLTAPPSITAISDMNICGSVVLPAIIGTNLSGNQAYYTATNGGGTKYDIGDVFNTAGETTLYAFDQTAVGSCPAETSFKILIRITTAGAISGDQTICINTVPSGITSATAGTGLGSIKYRWESSTTNASTGFSVITGATLGNYTPSALNTTTWFRRTTISTYNGVECESAPTTAIQITVQDAVTAGSISADQTICNNTAPTALASATAGTGSGTVSYVWEKSTTDATTGFTAISGANSATYSPGALSATTWFRRTTVAALGTNVCSSAPTTAIKITVQDVVTAGSIGTDQTICNSSIPATLSSTSAGTGSGTISYLWESSTTDATTDFTAISGANSATYSPSALTSTAWFRRTTVSTSGGTACISLPTATVKITVQDAVTAGSISADQTICNNTAPTAFASVTDGTGSGTLTYRWEQSSITTPVFTAISGEVLATYSPTALTETTFFRRITISTLNSVICESVPTTAIKVTVQNAVTAGSISADQTICNSSTPATLSSTSAGTGSGTISYLWESSTTDASTGFATISGAVSATYSPGALTNTTWFRRTTVSTIGGNACISTPTTAIKVSVQDVVTAGTISADQTICYNTIPTELASTLAGTGSGTITYRWESSSFATSSFTTIAGANQATYSPSALTASLYFRRITISTQNGTICESTPTTAIKITVQNTVTAGSISADQTICNNTAPTALASTTAGTGSGTISYVWEKSTTDATSSFTTISGANSATYSPGALTTSTWFRRTTVSTLGTNVCSSAPTTAIQITVQDAVTAGGISADQTICNNTAPTALASVTAGTGSGTISYVWESSTTDASTDFTTITGATSDTYNPSALTNTTWFRRITVSTDGSNVCSSAPTTAIQITVQDAVTAGGISADQTICNNTAPTALASTTAGTGSGTISYVWEKSTTDATTDFTAISGANSATYSPIALTSTTWFRRTTVSTLGTNVCSSASTTAIKITVQDAVTAGSISADQTICNNTAPTALASATAGTGSGTISYVWESSTTDATTGFTAISGANSATYSPGALTTSTWFRRTTVSTLGTNVCSSAPTTAIKITVQDAVTAGGISADQTICNNTAPTALASTTAGTGSGTISYVWEKSTTDATSSFTTIIGANSATYSPGALSATTWFRRTTVSTLGTNVCSSAPTTAIQITVQDAVTAGGISADQTICNNTAPTALASTTAGTGSGTISYVWEKTTTDATTDFTAISGANSATYSPGALTTSTWFRRTTVSTLGTNVCSSAPTTAIKITVQDAVTAGGISADQTICNNTAPTALASTTAGTGSGTISYVWEKSTTDATSSFTTIIGANSATYSPGALSATTWFRRTTVSTLGTNVCSSAPTTAIQITVQDAVTAGGISADQTICNNTAPTALASTTAGTGSGTISYVWEKSTTDATSSFTTISGANSATYSPGALTTSTWFRRTTVSTLGTNVCSSAPTTAIKITVQDAVTAGGISADQTICNNTAPTALASTTAGTGSGTIRYVWEKSTTDATTDFTAISGANSATYSPIALTSTTWFRRTTVSTLGTNVCSSASTTAIKITVQDAVTAGSISADQTICNNTAPTALASATDGTGSGTVSYVWEKSTTDATSSFTTISGANSATYSPGALTTSTWFRRTTVSTLGTNVCSSAPTTAIKITVQDAVTAGGISADQTICNNTAPTALASTTAGTGSGTISYVWEKSTTDATTDFTAISGANSATYSPIALTSTTWFRRTTVSTLGTNVCSSAPTTAIKITVQDAVTAGGISVDQTICNNTAPTALASTTAGTGSGTVSYVWEKSTTDATTDFTAISGANSATYSPIALTSTTWFRRTTVSTLGTNVCSSASTTAIKITVQDAVTAGSISADQTICNNTAPTALASATAGTGSGTISYVWEKSTTDATTDFTAISGANSATYSPGALSATTWFRRTTVSTLGTNVCSSAPTTAIKITVQDAVTAGGISADQTICNNTAPTALASATNGTGSGTVSYVWEKSTTDATTDFTAISGANSATYSPGALTTSTWFRRTTVSTLGTNVCSSAPTTAIQITVQDAVTAGGISADQTICNNTAPTALASTTDGTGSGTISYVWEKSTTDATTDFTAISGANSATYSPIALTSTTWFRRTTVSTLGTNVCSSASTTAIKITVQDAVTAGSISADQTICNNTAPTALASTTAGTGSGTISYVWEKTTTDATTDFTAISGANSATYSPGALSATTWFRRTTVSTLGTNVCSSASTTAIKITVQDAVTAGSISADQTICNNTAPTALASTTAGTGSGTISYVWEKTTTDATTDFTAISGANSATYSPGALSATTWFRRTTVSTLGTNVCSSASTTAIKITVQDAVTAGSISADQTICNNTAPTALASTTAGTGSGTISYVWEKSTTDATSSFTTISGANSATYSPGALTTSTWFRRTTVSTLGTNVCSSAPTTAIKITVQDAVTAGGISADQTICNNTAPTALASTTAGTGSGTISYVWEKSTTDATSSFTTISGANSATYSPGALTTSTWFRRTTVSTLGTNVCSSAPTTAIQITVQDAVTAGSISADQTICNNTAPTALASATDGTGSGTVSYVWEKSTTDATSSFTTISGANSATYSPGALSATTWFRRTTVSTLGTNVCSSAPTTAIKITVLQEIVAYANQDQQQFNSAIFNLNADIPNFGSGKWSVTSGVLAEPITDDTNAKTTVKLIPNTSVTLRWTVSELNCSKFDEVVLSYIAQANIVTVKKLKDLNQTTFTPGQVVVYTINVTNNGPSDAKDVHISDLAPAGTTMTAWSATILNGTVVLPNSSGTGNLGETISSLPNGAVVSYEVSLLTQANFIGDLTNTVVVSSATEDPSPTCTTCIAQVIHPSGLPIAIDNEAVITDNRIRTVLIPLLDNDQAGTSPLAVSTIEITKQPQYGTLVIHTDGTVTYTSKPGYEGDDYFNYRVKDQLGNWSNAALVHIIVNKEALQIPNVITPNGDGKNDSFIIGGRANYDAATLEIYNRWGNQIYQNTHYEDTWNGEGLNEGTYFYIIKLKKGSKIDVLKGWILIKR